MEKALDEYLTDLEKEENVSTTMQVTVVGNVGKKIEGKSKVEKKKGKDEQEEVNKRSLNDDNAKIQNRKVKQNGSANVEVIDLEDVQHIEVVDLEDVQHLEVVDLEAENASDHHLSGVEAQNLSDKISNKMKEAKTISISPGKN